MHISAVNNRNYRGGDFWILAPAFCTILQLSVFFFNVCFFAQWCDSIQQAWSLCEGPQPEASALSAGGGDGSVSRCCSTCWISCKKNSNGKVALLLPSILISSCLKRPLPMQVGFGELPFNRMDCFPTYPDICFRVDGFNFLCHKVRSSKVKCLPVDTLPDRDVRCVFYSWLQAFFCGRSDYFRALLEDHFSEGEQLQSHPSTLVITLHNISHEIFIHVMYYIYTDNTEVSVLLLFGLCLWNFLSFSEKNMVSPS